MDEKDTTASFIDKTDWRKTIHRKLEACVDAEGTLIYPQRVKSLISAVAAEYPGFNAATLIETKFRQLEIKWNNIANTWINENPSQWAYPWVKWEKTVEWMMGFYKEIFEYIKNLCASKRMLLWGIKKITGGEQMED
jgi:hypothetical protein